MGGQEVLSTQFASALLLSTLAGLSTGIGGLLAVSIRRISDRMMAASLGFAAGIMLTVALSDMLPHSGEGFVEAFGGPLGALGVVGSVLIGISLSLLVDKLVPKEDAANVSSRGSMRRLGIVTALAICIHNFPEGIATFMSSYADLRLGLPMTMAVALHNIPEGMAVSMPIYYATGSRGRAVGYALLSGLSEPLGAIFTYLLLRPYMNEIMLATMFGVIVGLMCTIAFDELIPAALSYKRPRATLTGLLSGVLIMGGGIFIMG